MDSEQQGLLVEIAERLGALEQRMSAVPHEEHNDQHDYLSELIEREKLKKEFWRGVVEKLATTGILGAIGLMLSVVIYAARQFTGH